MNNPNSFIVDGFVFKFWDLFVGQRSTKNPEEFMTKDPKTDWNKLESQIWYNPPFVTPEHLLEEIMWIPSTINDKDSHEAATNVFLAVSFKYMSPNSRDQLISWAKSVSTSIPLSLRSLCSSQTLVFFKAYYDTPRWKTNVEITDTILAAWNAENLDHWQHNLREKPSPTKEKTDGND